LSRDTTEYWAMLFARHNFFRGVDFDAFFIAPWAVRFRRMAEPVSRIVSNYERRMWYLLKDSTATRELNLEQRQELAEKE